MTRRVLVALGLAAGLLLADGSAPASCHYCYSGTCYGSAMCGAGCMCLKRGHSTSGACFSAGALPVGDYHQ